MVWNFWSFLEYITKLLSTKVVGVIFTIKVLMYTNMDVFIVLPF